MTDVERRPQGEVLVADPWTERVAVGGVPLVVSITDDAARTITEHAVQVRSRGAQGTHVHLASAQTIALAARHPDMDQVINGDGWVLPDGKPLTWVSWLRRDRPRLHQTRGVEVFTTVCDVGRRLDVGHFLLGSTPAVLSAMRSNLERMYPGIRIVGAESPPFRPASAEELIERDTTILTSGAHIVWVGLGTPKQDFESARIAARLPVVAVAVGAAFDFSAGSLRVAPAWMSKVGLEWLFRLWSEPRRLWRRYTFDSWAFIRAVIRHGRRRRVLRLP